MFKETHSLIFEHKFQVIFNDQVYQIIATVHYFSFYYYL